MNRRNSLVVAVLAMLALSLGLYFAFDRPAPRAVARSSHDPNPTDHPSSLETPPPEPARSELEATSPPPPGPDPTAEILDLTFLVTDVEAMPLKSAEIRITSRAGILHAQATTDSDGRARLPVQPDRNAGIHVSNPGHEHRSFGTNIQEPRELTIRLRPLVEIEGLVLDATTREPIPHASVTRPGSECELCGACETQADALGRFALDCMPLEGRLEAGPLDRGTWIRAEAPGYVAAQRGFELRARGAFVELQLERGIEVTFLVFDRETDLPLADATINGSGVSVLTDAHGRASSSSILSGQASGPLTLSCSADDHATLRFFVDPQLHDPTRPIVLRLPELAWANVTVRDPDDQAIERALIGVRMDRLAPEAADPVSNLVGGWRLDIPRSERFAATAADGRARIGMVAESDFQLSLTADGFDREERELTSPAPGATLELSFVLDPVPGLEGPTATVCGRVLAGGTSLPMRVSWMGPSRSGSARARADGQYVLKNVEVGLVRIETSSSFSRPECSDRTSVGHAVQLTAGETLELDLELDLPLSTIRGRVTHADGLPAENQAVWATAETDCLTSSTRTDVHGAFELVVQADVSAYDLTADRDGGQGARLEGVAPGSDGVELVLPELVELRWRAIEAATGNSVACPTLLWCPSGEEWLREESMLPGPDGWHSLALPAGTYDLGVRPRPESGCLPLLRSAVEVRADQPPMTFELEPALELVLRLAEGQAPWPDDGQELIMALLLEDEQYDLIGSAGPGNLQYMERGFLAGPPDVLAVGSGPFVLRGLRPGRHRFRAFPDTIQIEPPELTVAPGMPPVELRWSWR